MRTGDRVEGNEIDDVFWGAELKLVPPMRKVRMGHGTEE